MTSTPNSSKRAVLSANFYLWLFVVGLLTFAIHEVAHWLTGTALGYEMTIRPNLVRSLSPMLPEHAALVDAAGPLFTILQGIVGYLMVRARAALMGFALVYLAFFMRLLATLVSAFNPNDEARISVYLGLGSWTLPLLVTAGLTALTVLASRRLELTWKDHLGCYVLASIVVSTVVAADHFLF